MEPDHAAMIEAVLVRWPDLRLVVNAKTLPMLKMYFPTDSAAIDDALVVKEGDTLDLGKHKLTFVMAPMVHWPEVMMTFDTTTGTLFSADAFGTFGALEGALFADEVDFAGKWLDDARRYYTNIVGKYGAQVQAVLKKAATLPIETIAPLHGPVWRKNLGWFIGKYDLWSRCEPEEKAVVVLYGSMYGNTASAANALAAKVAAKGVKVAVHDLSCIDNSEAVAECWRASTIVGKGAVVQVQGFQVLQQVGGGQVNAAVVGPEEKAVVVLYGRMEGQTANAPHAPPKTLGTPALGEPKPPAVLKSLTKDAKRRPAVTKENAPDSAEIAPQ